MSVQFPYLINSIYPATEGEGLWIGHAQVFVRFQGCSIGCVNCDSQETWAFDHAYASSLQQITEKIRSFAPIQRVSITGGDPMHPGHKQSVLELIQWLKSHGYYVNIEAAGSRVDHQIFDLVDFISFDVKTPSTSVKTPYQNLLKLFEQYPQKFQIKSVIAHRLDFDYCYDLFTRLKQDLKRPIENWFLTPCLETGAVFDPKKFQEIYQWNFHTGGVFRVVGQQHKWVYGTEEKLV